VSSAPEPATGPSREYLRLCALSSRELDAIFVRGEMPQAEALAGWEHRGTNTPAYARLLGIRKFVKGFYRDDGGEVYGYNMPVAQNRLEDAWIAEPKRFGFYRVAPVDPEARDNAYLHALLRDYLVRIERGSDELLLGKAFVALGPVRVPVSTFLLERFRPTDFRR
jgi:hypothetical protein